MNLQEAMSLHKQGRLQQAEQGYIEALDEDFDNAQALYLLGTVYLQIKRPALAAQLFQRSLQLKKDSFECWNNLGNCFKAANKDKDAAMCWNMALEIEGRSDFEYSDIYNNLATIHINAGTPEVGIPLAEKAIELRLDHPDANWNLALLNLESGNYAKGFDGYQWGFNTHNRLFRNYGDNVKPWDGSEGKNVIVWGEQGIGDEILFSSMIPDLVKISNKVIFDCHPRLQKIFEASFPDIKCYGTRKDEYLKWPIDHPDMNAKIAIGDLGRFFRRSIEDFPEHQGYLKADPERIEHYRKKLKKISNKMKVGISWTGGYKKTRKDYRSIPLEAWEPILKEDAEFISLQYTPDAYNAVAMAEDEFDVRIHHWPSVVQNFDYHETAALVSALDLIITVNTSLHHLAGALNVPCWTLTPKAKAWRYYSPDEDGHSIPWYSSVYQYQQKNLYDWEPIIKKVARDLRAMAKERVAVCA